ncbi:MAG: hypothetical protein ABL955_02970 [Elusimicrobiota bacterium]
MARKAFGLMLTFALAFSWAAPLLAQPEAPSHACCMGGEAPKPSPSHGGVPACCRPSEALPASVAVTVQTPAPALLSSVAIVTEPFLVRRISLPRFVPAAQQAPPGTHSGLSPPTSGL